MARRYDDEAELVLAARDGDASAFTTLFQRWFDPCVDVARRILHDDGRAEEVAQDAFLTSWEQLGSLRDPGAFGGWVLRSTRNKALNRLERERRASATDDASPTFTTLAAPDDPGADVTRAEQEELLWAASVVLGERDASVLDLHLRHGLTPAEIADELEIAPNAAHQTLHRLRGRLAVGIRAWVLWQHGEPRCDELRGLLADAGLVDFGRPVVSVVERHAPDCDECSARLAAILDPSAMFAAVPLLAVHPDVRRRVAEALHAQGVPIDPVAAAEAPAPPADGAPAAPDPVDPTLASADAPAALAAAVGPAPPGAPPVAPTDEAPSRRPLAAWLGGAAAVVVVGGLLAWGCAPDDDAPVVAGPLPTTTTTAAPASTSTTAAPSTTSPGSTTTSPTTTAPTTTVAPAPGAPPTTQGAISPPAHPPVAPTPPPVAPPPPAPPPAVPPPPPTTAPAAPVVDSFTATPAVAPGGACPAGQWATTLAWTTTGATSVTVDASDIAAITGLPADGTVDACRLTPGAPPGGWSLSATGPGGTTGASA